MPRRQSDIRKSTERKHSMFSVFIAARHATEAGCMSSDEATQLQRLALREAEGQRLTTADRRRYGALLEQANSVLSQPDYAQIDEMLDVLDEIETA